jgi:protein-S-isoprenylcysteine O-methyltransferase Ste14
MQTTLPSRLARIATTFVAMSGFRLDRLNATWVVLGALSFGLAHEVTQRASAASTLAYWVFTLALYYGGNSVFLGGAPRERLIAWLGEARATRVYDTALGLMFVNQGLGLGCVASLALPGTTLAIAPPVALVLGLAMCAVGITVKVWATMVLGVDGYYYRDLLLGRSASSFVCRGPYRLFANPMYGIGQLHAYGFALLHRSLSGLVAAAVCQLLVYAFYFAVEKPFVERVYLRAPAAA